MVVVVSLVVAVLFLMNESVECGGCIVVGGSFVLVLFLVTFDAEVFE